MMMFLMSPLNKDQSAYAFDYSLNTFQLAASPTLDSLMLAAMAETLVDTPSTDEIQTETVKAASTMTKEVTSSSPLNMALPMEISFLAFFTQHRADGGALKKNETTTGKICRALIPILIIWAGEALTVDTYMSKLLLNCRSWWSVTVASGEVAVVGSLALAPESNPKLMTYNNPKHEFSVF